MRITYPASPALVKCDIAPTALILSTVSTAPALLACPDNDEGGQAAWQRWSAAYPQAILTPAVGAKDLGDMHRAALTWPLDYSIPTTGEWLEAVLSAMPTNMAHTGPMSNENTQPDHCATSA